MGTDHTIFSKIAGQVYFTRMGRYFRTKGRRTRRFINVVPGFNPADPAYTYVRLGLDAYYKKLEVDYARWVLNKRKKHFIPTREHLQKLVAKRAKSAGVVLPQWLAAKASNRIAPKPAERADTVAALLQSAKKATSSGKRASKAPADAGAVAAPTLS
jgi:hypothetical protein